jgi:hypothetical protein
MGGVSEFIPWDEICNIYLKHISVCCTGRPPLNPKIVLGAVIIKHLNDIGVA